jgi:hypothetical protein
MWHASKVSACRRGLNSHETAMPRRVSSTWPRCREPVRCVGLSPPKLRRNTSGPHRRTPLQTSLCASPESVGSRGEQYLSLGETRARRAHEFTLQSVRWAAATITAVHHASGRGGMNTSAPRVVCAEKLPWLSSRSNTISFASSRSARPNQSLNHRTRYGGLSWPGLEYAVHFPSPGQAIPPHRAG